MTFKQLKNKPLIKLMTNRYMVTLVFFIVWMTFFDENSWLTQLKFNKEIDKLEREKDYYKSQIEQDKALIEKLNDQEALETFAREKYHMKKEHEAVFIIAYDSLEK
ncbi:MAG: septum formation initiator family protein [Lutibacter sp.]|jgi:cell division protein FtsB|nr:septum formation initiator family protein [Lutibacter sp.]